MNEAVLELTTKIPKANLVYGTCEFYWNMGHKTIKLFRPSGEDFTSEDFKLGKSIENIDKIYNISVRINKKKENRNLFFDTVNVAISENSFETQVTWDVDFQLKAWHLFPALYLIAALIISLYYAWDICPSDLILRRYCFALASAIFFVIQVWPLYYLFKHKMEKLVSHPSTEKYKKDFEDFIHRKEKELRSNNIK